MLARLTIRKKLLLIMYLFLFGVIVASVFVHRTVMEIRVLGPAFQRIESIRNLHAELAPSRATAVEPYLLAYQMLEEPDLKARAALEERIRRMQKEFEDVHLNGRTHVSSNQLAQRLTSDVYAAGVRFFRT